jgi:hypothetical protein
MWSQKHRSKFALPLNQFHLKSKILEQNCFSRRRWSCQSQKTLTWPQSYNRTKNHDAVHRQTSPLSSNPQTPCITKTLSNLPKMTSMNTFTMTMMQRLRTTAAHAFANSMQNTNSFWWFFVLGVGLSYWDHENKEVKETVILCIGLFWTIVFQGVEMCDPSFVVY